VNEIALSFVVLGVALGLLASIMAVRLDRIDRKIEDIRNRLPSARGLAPRWPSEGGR
jgi:hypothetical protein